MMEARICRIAGDLSVFRDGSSMAREILDALIVFLEFCYREIVILDSFDELSDMQRNCLGHTRNALSTLRLIEEENIVRSSTTIISEQDDQPTLFISVKVCFIYCIAIIYLT